MKNLKTFLEMAMSSTEKEDQEKQRFASKAAADQEAKQREADDDDREERITDRVSDRLQGEVRRGIKSVRDEIRKA